MQPIKFSAITTLTLAAVWLGACAQSGPMAETNDAKAAAPEAQAATPVVAKVSPPAVKRVDPMADVPGDKPLTPLKGAVERAECATGSSDLHRLGFEARGGQITYFAYYNKWQLRTCSLELTRDAPGTKWRLTSDGATRVQTPEGRIIIRARPGGYEFEFQEVSRRGYCSAEGRMSGTISVTRTGGKSACTVNGFANTGDS